MAPWPAAQPAAPSAQRREPCRWLPAVHVRGTLGVHHRQRRRQGLQAHAALLRGHRGEADRPSPPPSPPPSRPPSPLPCPLPCCQAPARALPRRQAGASAAEARITPLVPQIIIAEQLEQSATSSAHRQGAASAPGAAGSASPHRSYAQQQAQQRQQQAQQQAQAQHSQPQKQQQGGSLFSEQGESNSKPEAFADRWAATALPPCCRACLGSSRPGCAPAACTPCAAPCRAGSALPRPSPAPGPATTAAAAAAGSCAARATTCSCLKATCRQCTPPPSSPSWTSLARTSEGQGRVRARGE
jgi:hypothetical protein